MKQRKAELIAEAERRLDHDNGSREQLHKAMVAGIAAQVQQATLAMDSQEVDLLRALRGDHGRRCQR